MSSFENFVKCRVVSPVAAAATDIALHEAVEPFSLPPEEGGILVLTDSPNNPSVIEVIRYGYRNALGLYDVQRGQEGTAAVAWTGPVYCYQSLMAGDFQALLDSKVDKAAGQSLMTDAERTKLGGIQAGAQVNSVTSVAGRTGAVALAKGDVGLGNVDNTSDANKPVSTAQQAALNAKAPLASPALTGTPTAPTPAAGTNTTQIATAAFVQAALAALVNGAPGALNQLNELAAAMGNDPNFATTMLNSLALKAPLESPALTGSPTAPTPAAEDADTSIATTAFVRAAMRLFGLSYPSTQQAWHTSNLIKQTSATDTTAGALMAVGAFGLGSKAVTAAVDFNELPTLYPYTGFIPLLTNNLSANAPGSNSYFYVQQMFWSGGTNVCQIAYPYRMDSDGFWMRTLFNGSWSAWRRMYHSGNILGTVSQAGGVPTGAIIERGSNANGDYVRFADGTQICTRRISALTLANLSVSASGAGGGFRSGENPVTFAASFVAPPVTSVALTNNAQNVSATCYASSSNSWSVVFRTAGTAVVIADALTVELKAEGRWY